MGRRVKEMRVKRRARWTATRKARVATARVLRGMQGTVVVQ
jgi:hypothetical protein